jgi:hypothetical protein
MGVFRHRPPDGAQTSPTSITSRSYYFSPLASFTDSRPLAKCSVARLGKRAHAGTAVAGCHTSTTAGYNEWVNMEMTTMTLKVQYLTKLEDGTQIQAGWYVTTPFCPGVVFATEQEALAYGRTEELRQDLINRVRAMSFDELRALKVKMT